MVLKIIGLGMKGYFSVGFNVFDFFLVLVSLVEFIANSTGNSQAEDSAKWLRMLRMFRVLRVAKLVR